ncbi:hypothetical protein OG401_21115 [Kitasatospora purpeofusca]|uniref:hypothetical protein n=1 Tax=Kitasatospora purpeofusca TaxID=67352 RepID=UPI00224FEAF7|nr:hypothetical protein [Kitasatospora purpeofusca]MCX4686782.1 hypothetical protein [Kitasatospora purpeofusca]
MPPSRADLAAKHDRVRELAAAGRSTTSIAAELRMDRRDVRRVRAEAGIPALPGGTTQLRTVIEKWRTHTRETDGGHLEWTGGHTQRGYPVMRHSDTAYSAHRIAYQVQHGTPPTGHAKARCGIRDCVAPEHQVDTGGRRLARAPRTDYPTIEARLDACTRETEDGHLEWTGPVSADGRPLLSWRGRTHLAHRVAFQRHYNREPVGNVGPGCDRPGCIAGRHLDDRLTRAQHATAYAALGL